VENRLSRIVRLERACRDIVQLARGGGLPLGSYPCCSHARFGGDAGTFNNSRGSSLSFQRHGRCLISSHRSTIESATRQTGIVDDAIDTRVLIGVSSNPFWVPSELTCGLAANQSQSSEKNFKDQQDCQKLRRNTNEYLHAAVAGIQNGCAFQRFS